MASTKVINMSNNKQQTLLELIALETGITEEVRTRWDLVRDYTHYPRLYCRPTCQSDVLATMMGVFDLFGQSMIYACHEECFHVTFRSWYECNMTSLQEYLDYVKECLSYVRQAIDNETIKWY